MLMVLDGWGLNPGAEGNAVARAKTPVLDRLLKDHPCTKLRTDGEAVGLRPGLMGNSEVGHMTIGSGRVIWQDITRIDRAIDEGTFFEHPLLLDVVEHVRAKTSRLHLLGLVSTGGVHSDEKHYFALIDFARKQKVPVRFHVLTDGRDTPPKSGVEHVRRLAKHLEGAGKVATLMGRYFGMDRDKRWDRLEKAYDAMTLGDGRKATDPVAAVEQAYAEGETDEFIKPFAFPDGMFLDGDALLCFNFRADRMREITSALMLDAFDGF
jgi:2,3-bisphosphoglycerate-independent phosphoglycerate mutase